jgi:type II secretory pathway pseudopilin PulG
VLVPVAGITLIAVLLMIAVSGIMMARAMETWDSQVRHELEETLIGRGEEYKSAIELYQRQNGRFPLKLEELCPKEKADVRYIRRCWKDPVTGKDFRRIAPGEAGKRKLENLARERELEGTEDAQGGFGVRDRNDDGPARSDIKWSDIKWSKEQPDGDRPFVGVASDAPDERKSFRDFNGSFTYSEWEFVATIAPVAGSQGSGRSGSGRPGTGGTGTGGTGTGGTGTGGTGTGGTGTGGTGTGGTGTGGTGTGGTGTGGTGMSGTGMGGTGMGGTGMGGTGMGGTGMGGNRTFPTPRPQPTRRPPGR